MVKVWKMSVEEKEEKPIEEEPSEEGKREEEYHGSPHQTIQGSIRLHPRGENRREYRMDAPERIPQREEVQA
jgi:hypothetical protein